MSSRKDFTSHTAPRIAPLRRTLAAALALGLGFTGVAYGQATTGSIFGSVPGAAGDVVTATSQNGLSRQGTVDANGRYTITHLPLGTYTVTLQHDGQTVSSRESVGLSAGGGTEVSFAGGGGTQNAQELGAVSVVASALPPIDVSNVSTSTVITADELAKLPVSRSAESIALLSPGTVAGSGYFGNVVSFGGAGATENAYYVNGFNTTEAYSYTGSSYQLPYGSIDQQQTFTGGYTAKYGRSDGGVINQIGKRGTNEWHFGAQVVWAPKTLGASPDNTYYPYQNTPDGYVVVDPDLQGTLQRYRNANKSWSTEYSVYAGGPLIKDTLFLHVAMEQTKTKGRTVASTESGTDNYYHDNGTNFYGKLDWNINDNNVLELTKLKKTDRNGAGSQYFFDNDTRQDTDFIGENSVNKTSTDAYIAHFTSFLTDSLTFSVLYGEMEVKNPVLYPFSSPNPGISASSAQNPAYWVNGSPIRNDQTEFYAYAMDARSKTSGLRADLSYQLSDHLLEVGIDNQKYSARDQGEGMSGPGYAWIYNVTGDPTANINPALGVGAPGESYYVDRYIYSIQASMSMQQKAYYLQDSWQVNDNLLLSLGLRNDHFINYNNRGQAFVDEDNQWEPRVGFSWDVYGDSSFKLYGNAGRYYLALPQSVAQRAATPSSYSDEYFTYTGIDANGEPTGLTPVGGVNGAPPPGPVSANNEIGQDVDPDVVTAKNLKAQYQDEFILGFDKSMGPNWVYGTQLTYRKLGTAIDDICDVDRIAAKLESMGLDPDNYAWGDPGCRIFNPGETGTFKVNGLDGTEATLVSMSKSDWGLPRGASRKYYGVNLYLSHPFADNWFTRIDYTFSRSWGNAEGQVRSDIGQQDVSKTEDWDFGSLMDGAYGYLANHRRHQLKARGAYQITPEWLVSGTLRIQSGTPKSCLGFYGANADENPSGYGSDYHWCNGKVSPPGATGFTPWTKQLDLGVRYTPSFAKGLAVSLDLFNALNEQHALQIDPNQNPRSGIHTISNTYNTGLFYEQPRYVRMSVSYDY